MTFLHEVKSSCDKTMYYHSFIDSVIDEEESKKKPRSNHCYRHRLHIIYSAIHTQTRNTLWWEAVFNVGTAPTQAILPASQSEADGILKLFDGFNSCEHVCWSFDICHLKIIYGIVSDSIPVEGRIDFDIIALLKEEKEYASQEKNSSGGRQQHSGEGNSCDVIDPTEGSSVKEAELQSGSTDPESSPEDDRNDQRVSDSRESRLRVFRNRRQSASIPKETGTGIQDAQRTSQGEGSSTERVL